jgi:fucose permease
VTGRQRATAASAGVLLALCYLGFVSLGLPDSVLGGAWPAIRRELARPLDDAGQLLLLTTVGVAVSGVLSGRLLARLATGTVLAGSALLAAGALALFAQARGWPLFLLAAVIAGLGGGAVDAALNGYVARHHSVRHMNWLHGCWGIGASLGPLVVAAALRGGHSWRLAYLGLALVELALGLAFLASRPWWREAPGANEATDTTAAASAAPQAPAARAASLRGLTPAMRDNVLFFFVYCGIEASAGLWGSSLLVARGASLPEASATTSLYWGMLTAGRFLLGAVAERVGPARLLAGCCSSALAALVLLSLPGTPRLVAVLALALLGLALAPIYPLLMHDTPHRFGAAEARYLVGYQVAAASVGIATVPWLVGLLAQRTSLGWVPPALTGLAVLLVLIEWRRRRA